MGATSHDPTVQLGGTLRACLQEKIGIANFLWSFAAEASTKVKNDEARLTRELTGVKVRPPRIETPCKSTASPEEKALACVIAAAVGGHPPLHTAPVQGRL